MNDAQKKLMEIGQSRWALTFCIAYTGKLIFQLSEGALNTGLIEFLLSLFICIGAWLACWSCRKNSLSKTGFFMINVIMTIMLVFFVIVAGMAFFAAMGTSGINMQEISAAFLILIILIFLAALGYVYGLRKTASRVSRVAKGEENELNVSLWPIVVQTVVVILEVLGGAAAIILIFALFFMGGSEILQFYNGFFDIFSKFLSNQGFSNQYFSISEADVQNYLSMISSQSFWTQQILLSVFSAVLEFLVQLSALVLLRRLRFSGKASDTEKRFTQDQDPVAQEQYWEDPQKREAESGKGWEEAWEKVWKEGPESTEPEKSNGDSLQNMVSEDNLPQKKKKSVIWKATLVLIAVVAVAAFIMYQTGYLVIVWESSSPTQTAAVGETTEEITATESAEPDITPETTAAETAAVEGTKPAEETDEVGTTVEKTYVVTGSRLNVRGQASADSEKLATLSQGTVCRGTGNASEDGAWIEIYYNDQNAVGWVSAQYIQEQTAVA